MIKEICIFVMAFTLCTGLGFPALHQVQKEESRADNEDHDPYEKCLTKEDVLFLFEAYRDSDTTDFTVICSEDLLSTIPE